MLDGELSTRKFKKRAVSWSVFVYLVLLCYGLVHAPNLSAQDRSSDLGGIRGNRAQLSITIKSGSAQLVGPLVTVKLFYLGAPAGQISTSKGRAVFILNQLGDYTITADAVGYRSAQKEFSIRVAVEAEEEINLQSDSSANEAVGAGSGPMLAPKAKEAYDKGVESLNADKLDQAEKHLDEAAKLAPNHPDVLYMQGVLFLKQKRFGKAQDVLLKATQIDPKNAHAFSALGMAFVDQGRYDLAIPQLEQSLQLDNVSWETHWTLAGALYKQEQYENALKESQLALSQAHGMQPSVELLLAQTQVAVEKFEEAGETLRAFLKNHPNDKGAPTAKKWLDRLVADGKIRKQ